MRSLSGAIILTVVVFAFACKKDNAGDEADMFGTWVKGPNFGDTLWFMKKNEQFIIRTASYSTARPTYEEMEYRYKDGKLSIKLFSTSQEYSVAETFDWISVGKEFTIASVDLYPLYSYMATFQYKKL